MAGRWRTFVVTMALAGLALAPPARAAEREDNREYINVPGLVTCNIGGQTPSRGVQQYLGGDCFGVAPGETSIRLEVRDDQRLPTFFRWKFVDASGNDLTPYVPACGVLPPTAIPPSAHRLDFELPASVPGSVCFPATTGFVVAWSS